MAEDDDATDLALELHTPTRYLIGSIGFSFLGLGAWAVFAATNQAGTVALLSIGALLFVLGLVGRIPERGAIGSTNWRFAPLRRLMKSDLPEVRSAAAGEVLAPENRGRVPAPLVQEASNVLRERDVIAILRDLLPALVPGSWLGVDVPLPNGGRVDLILRGPEDQGSWQLPIEVARDVNDRRLRLVASYAESLSVPAAVVVTLGAASPARHTYVLNSRETLISSVGIDAPPGSLHATLNGAIRVLTSDGSSAPDSDQAT